MADVLTNVYAHRVDDGYDPTKLFQRKVNKRALPDYYEVIKEPMALSEIKKKVAQQEYKSFPEFVRDFALIPHNAQVYNRQDSQAYVDALEVKKVLEQELQKLAEAKIVSADVIKLPYLGEIPEQDPLLPEEEEEEEEEDDEEDVEEELEEVDVDDDDEDDGKRRKRRGPRSTAAIMKREGKADAKEDPESRKKRGRPPRVDTPMEARIKAIMKAIRKPRNSQNKLMVSAFERVPDKAVMPEYHAEIKSPMAMDVLKRKLKRKKYNSVDHFMQDVELMFENAKQYNEEDSQIYKDAVHLQKESRKVAEQEKAKDDSEFVMEEGRIPMPNGILHNGELWKVGDWVHIQNANDLTKPIVAQIYRTWQDAEGSKWVNACWYYRPEQTVHRFDRHFLENEVVKTGQYRDHPIDEVVDRCFVMFVTRYNKGRPRDFPTDKEIYVCEARYNEENHKLNKIKTWASCLPDEVRDKDYVMDLFDAPRKLKKIPSPIAYLLKDEQKETDDLPKPEWGAENAPPKIGAVHRRPRDPRDSPPPEPTPSPPPQPPPAPVMPTPSIPTPQMNGYGDTRQHYPLVAPSPSPMPAQTPQLPHMASAYGNAAPTYHNHSQSPAPHSYQAAPQSTGYQAITPSLPLSTPQPPAAIPQYATPRAPPSYQQPVMQQPPGGYRAPQPVEVYVLPDHANLSIPADVREQFQRDEQGRVLFFTAPPANDSGFVKEEGQALGHSASYLAMRAKRDAQRAAKRKADEAGATEREEAAKKMREEAEEKLKRDVAALRTKAIDALGDQLALATKSELQALLGNENAGALAKSLDRLVAVQGDAVSKRLAREAKLEQQKAAAQKSITGMTVRLEEKI
ncbi:chromatin structure-remodeling complex protein rsc1 [Paraphaeosphaeria sporulosa]|uniref:Chromatin structure-remodeling complex protein rsc1 n=1 Tax=Paraphaeosphaeria sporulosa TaxID=1460663 RepID=A0A177BZ53_9PLEO|nr:chromatin structure-remodeling complex protein rsc1 [Paraphaeosphaeria sporulosa]OAF99716.1 chromatin structure-remodeling complex protein rsc1 [Paraphaeosphaeria sporulosa]